MKLPVIVASAPFFQTMIAILALIVLCVGCVLFLLCTDRLEINWEWKKFRLEFSTEMIFLCSFLAFKPTVLFRMLFQQIEYWAAAAAASSHRSDTLPLPPNDGNSNVEKSSQAPSIQHPTQAIYPRSDTPTQAVNPPRSNISLYSSSQSPSFRHPNSSDVSRSHCRFKYTTWVKRCCLDVVKLGRKLDRFHHVKHEHASPEIDTGLFCVWVIIFIFKDTVLTFHNFSMTVPVLNSKVIQFCESDFCFVQKQSVITFCDNALIIILLALSCTKLAAKTLAHGCERRVQCGE